MSQFDMNKLEVALTYVNRITEGNNPVNNKPIAEDDVLNNPNIIRCMFFVRDVLEDVRRNNGIVSGRTTKAKKEIFPVEVLDLFEYREDNSISHIVRQINEPVEGQNVKKITAPMITSWLKEEGYLEDKEWNHAKNTFPTEKGMQVGLYSEVREYNGREYNMVMYKKEAQELVIDYLKDKYNIDSGLV